MVGSGSCSNSAKLAFLTEMPGKTDVDETITRTTKSTTNTQVHFSSPEESRGASMDTEKGEGGKGSYGFTREQNKGHSDKGHGKGRGSQ